ncbi:MAG TPA: DPP IV N-terminal domain-containing protein, partial [Vicinamibacterales bacterium]|nr:DPP IV N-terminal domain-containing protein [Vicinamibacterales bacterium]
MTAARRPSIRPYFPLLLLVSLLVPARLLAQERLLELDDIYGPTGRVNFSGTPAPAFVWIDDDHYAWPRTQGDRQLVDWMSVVASTGAITPLFDAARAESSLAAIPGVQSATASRAVHSRDLIFNAARTAAVLVIDQELYILTFADSRARKLTSSGGDKDEVSLSPDGSTAVFVRGNNLFLVDVATGRETAATQDGSPKILNGKMDWVYEEEIYGRGTTRAYWWSPDSSRLAFLRLDDTPVSTYITLDDISYDPKIETWPYPRAGDHNPTAKVGVVHAGGGAVDWIDLSKYAADDVLLVRVAWTPSSRLSYEIENRTQSWLDLNVADVSSAPATQRTLFRETSRFWINSEDQETPTWLADGSFVWLSERTGFRHAYRYSAAGVLIGTITSGKWEVRTVHGVDERSGWLYFSGTERTAIAEDVYRIKLDGSGFRRLSTTAGTHDAQFSPTFSYYFDRWNAVMTPTQVRLHRADGTDIRVVHANVVDAFARYKLSTPEFLQVKTRDGFVMEAMMIKPPNFDPRRKYPVYQFTYAGPHSQQVKNAWTLQTMYHELLAQKGIIVWVCDNRSASGKGLESTSAVYRRFGESELRDIEDGLGWLKQQPYVDAARIGIHGWSFGGFMTTYALTHSTSFAMGIAGGTVSDWRDYDTVYTERYLGLPQENADGYRNSSPRFAAANLHGALLLIHGAVD